MCFRQMELPSRGRGCRSVKQANESRRWGNYGAKTGIGGNGRGACEINGHTDSGGSFH